MTEKQLEEINVKIAKKLGWKNFRKERTPEPLNTRRMTGIAPGNFRHQFVPAYTNNLAYALKCVDWAVEHRFNFRMQRDRKEKFYLARFASDYYIFDGGATLPSLAICTAFLKIM